jgi:hypothetical protein
LGRIELFAMGMRIFVRSVVYSNYEDSIIRPL